MSIPYALYKNHLSDDPDAFMARVKPRGTLSLEDVIDEMIRQGSTVTKAEALAVLEEFFAALIRCLLRGYRILTPLFKLVASIKGIFSGPEALFDPARHDVRINISPGVRLRRAQRRITLKRVRATLPKPQPLSFYDIHTGTRNTVVTPGGLARLTGRRLKFNPDDPAQGLFFIDTQGQKTRVTTFAANKPARLAFIIPPTLTPGPYTLEVHALLRQTTRPRIGFFADTLHVL